jgi:hypothetical protein
MYRDSAVVHPVFRQNSPYLVIVNLGQRHSITDCNLISAFSFEWKTYPSALLLLDGDGWRLLVQSDTEAFQLVRQNSEIIERLQHIQNNKNQVAGSRNGDDLPTTTFTVLGSLNDTCPVSWRVINRLTRQIEDLYSGAVMLQSTRYSCQCGELVAGDFGVGSSN